MKQIVLEAEKRENSTKGAVRALRASGKVPGVAYGDQQPPVTLTVVEKALHEAMHSELGRNAIINLKIGSDSHSVLVKEIQRHPITRSIRHVDFHRISLKKKIETTVPVHTKGEAPGVKLGGGVLEFVVRDVRVRCLPTEIPASIDVDISALQLHEGVKGKDLKLPAGVELLSDAEGVILHVVTVHVVEETPAAAPTAEAAAAEPEVIKKGKVEEGEDAAGGDKKAAAAGAGAPAKAGAAKPEAKKPEGK